MIELISLHIPKTAGTSFEHTLRSVYGEENVLRIDVVPSKTNGRRDYSLNPNDIPEHTKVIHGHFNLSDMLSYFNLSTDIPIITWIRDPVKRTTSDFNYTRNILFDELKEFDVPLKTIRKIKRLHITLFTFAIKKREINKMTRLMGKSNLSKFIFVGVAEKFNEDLIKLEKLLGWNEKYQKYFVNVTSKKNIEKLKGIKKRIVQFLNFSDYVLYFRVKFRNNYRNI